MNPKIKAATLVEVVVALLIIIIVFAASSTLFVHILHTSPDKRSRWNQELQELAEEIKAMPEIKNERYLQNDGTIIYQNCTPYTAGSPLLHLKLEVINDNKIIARHEEIFFSKAN